MDSHDEMTATDVFKFDMQAARLTYLLSKRRKGEPAHGFPPMPPDPLVQNDPETPAFLRRQAD